MFVYVSTVHLPNIHILLVVPPTIVKSGPVEKIYNVQGTAVTLTCNYSGDPQPEITWTKNGN